MAKHGKEISGRSGQSGPKYQLRAQRGRRAGQRDLSASSFDATVEIHMRLGVDPRHADQQVRDVVVLPHGLGKTVRVLVFAQGEGATLAREAGADVVADDDETMPRFRAAGRISMWRSATPDLMGKVGRLGRVLGPRGLMPNPKAGTVVPAEDLPACHPRGEGWSCRIPRRQDLQPARADRQSLL